MEENEKVQSYSTGMEGSLNQISVKFPGMISDAEAEIKLRDRFFYRVHKTQRDSIRYLYDIKAAFYTQLLVVAREAEAEVHYGMSGMATVKKPKLLQQIMSWSV